MTNKRKIEIHKKALSEIALSPHLDPEANIAAAKKALKDTEQLETIPKNWHTDTMTKSLLGHLLG